MPPIPKLPPLIPGDLNRGNGMVAIGDSITIRGGLAGSYDDGNSYWTQGCLLSNGRVLNLGNAGVSGNTLAQMQARLATDVIAVPGVDKCLILGGTNDVANGVALSSSLATLTAMIAQLRARSIEPVLCAIPPRNSGALGGAFRAQIAAFNTAVRDLAQRHGCHFLDFHTPLADPATGQYKAGYSSDNVHPDVPAEKLMAALVANNLAPELPYWTPYLCNSDGDPNNLLPNGCFATDTNADGVADGWTASGSGGTATWSLQSDTAIQGNWQVLTVTAATSRGLALGVTQAGHWNPGDVIAVSGRIQASGLEAGGMTATIRVDFGTSNFGLLNLMATDVAGGVVYRRLTIPTNPTQLTVRLANSVAGTGVLKFAQWTIVNLSTQGLVQ